MKIYIVKGEHPTGPGSPELVTLDKSAADAFAAELVSVLARDIADRDGDEERTGMKIYIVKGEHPTGPGSPELVTLDKSAADAFAAELVSVLARDIADRDGDEEDVDQPAPEDWQSHLRWCQARQYMHFRKDRFPVSYEEARKAIEEMSDNERVVETECDVRIEEHDIEAPAPDVAVIVEGGIVQHVTARGGPVRVIVVDYDVDEEHLPDGVVMVPQDQSDPAPADITVHSVDHDSAPEFWQAVAGDQPASCQNPNLAAAMHAADECAAAAAPFNAAAQSAKRAQEAAADIISGGEPEAASASIDGDELHCVVHTDAFLLAPHIELRAGDMLGIDPETGEVRKALPGDKVAGRFDPRTMTVDPDGYLTVANPGLFDPKPSPRLIETDVQKARLAVDHIRKARDLLKDIGAQRALDKTRRALNSAEGALRHAENKETRQGKEG